MTDDTADKVGLSAETQTSILAQALPYMQAHTGRTILIKYGGHAMGDETLSQSFARDVALLQQSGVRPVVVHGGGPQIGNMLKRMNIESHFAAGMRVTDRATVEIVEMVLAGSINKGIVARFNGEGARAIGLCGKDGNMVRVRKMERTERDPDSQIENIVDLGFVGEPQEVSREVLDLLIASNIIPVIAPVAFGPEGHTYNVNADTFAGAVAGALDAERLLFLTDVPGVLDKDGKLLAKLTVSEARALIEDGTVSGGMIPKVETCIHALEQGVEAVVIVNGRVRHAVLLELFTEHGAGTMIVPDEAVSHD
ncbi:MAG: acetylglutamate kinase [Pseudomonadota bacterium]